VNEVSIKATEVLDDSTRSFASSVFVQLESLPKSYYNKQLLEVEDNLEVSDRFLLAAEETFKQLGKMPGIGKL